MTDDLLDVFSMGIGAIVPPVAFESALLYGGAGSGKTHFALGASRLEQYSPMLVIDTENSVSGVIDNYRQRDPNNPTDIAFDPKRGGIVDVVRPIEKWGSTAYENTMILLDAVADGKTIYKSVVIDVADVLQAWGLQHHDDPRNSFAKYDMIDKDLTGAPLPGKDGKANMGLFYRLKMSGLLSFLVVHEKMSQPDEGAPVAQYQWAGQGKGKIGGIPDAVFYFRRKAKGNGAETTMFTVGGATFEGKNRFSLPNKYINPTFAEVLEDAQKNGATN